MNIDDMRAVKEAAARSTLSDFEHDHAAPELQAAVAWAVMQGMPIREVANAAHMTALEVLDAADALKTKSATSISPLRNPGPHTHPIRPPGMGAAAAQTVPVLPEEST